MFRQTGKVVPRAKKQVDYLVPIGIPYKGLNTRSPFGSMDPNDAIAVNNVLVETQGLRTRKGYTEWARDLPAVTPVHTIMNYYPGTYQTSSQTTGAPIGGGIEGPSPLGPGPGEIFAAQGTAIYDVTAGGTGPWTAEAGVTGPTPYWQAINYQNVAGNFLLIANAGGGYAYYNGTVWAQPTLGVAPGQISGVDPVKIVWVVSWKERIWFIEKDSSRAWYLPVGQITGVATLFDFGSQMDHGGPLIFLGNWTVDGGAGVDDMLVAIGSQGDVAIYKGTDPNDATTFGLHGTWYSGPLPAGYRAVDASGGDILILTQFGVVPITKLFQPTYLAAQSQEHLSWNVDPLIASMMRQYGTISGWQIMDIAKEELLLIRFPELLGTTLENTWLAFKTTTKAWSTLSELPFAHILNTGPLSYAGTLDGRIVRAFNGELDDVRLATPNLGVGIKCRVTPAYNHLEAPGHNKVLKMIRPYFLSVSVPSVSITVLANYDLAAAAIVPAVPINLAGGKWGVGLWDVALWGGLTTNLHKWLGAEGWGTVLTVQLDYITGGETILTAEDYWCSKGGVL